MRNNTEIPNLRFLLNRTLVFTDGTEVELPKWLDGCFWDNQQAVRLTLKGRDVKPVDLGIGLSKSATLLVLDMLKAWYQRG